MLWVKVFFKDNNRNLSESEMLNALPMEQISADEKTETYGDVQENDQSVAQTEPRIGRETVGRMFFLLRDSVYQCSASSVASFEKEISAAKNIVFTAGHCVFSDGSYNGDIIYVPDYGTQTKDLPQACEEMYFNALSPCGQWNASSAYVSRNWQENSDFVEDQAIFNVHSLKNKDLIEVVGGNDLGTHRLAAQTSVQILGYPGSYGGVRNHQLRQCYGDTRLHANLFENNSRMDCAMGPGASGGPWVTQDGVVFAAHSRGGRDISDAVPNGDNVLALYARANGNFHISDSQFLACVNKTLNQIDSGNRSSDALVTVADVTQITVLSCSDAGIENLQGIGFFKNLEFLRLNNNDMQNLLDFVAVNLPKLSFIDLDNNNISSIAGLQNTVLPNLATLLLNGNSISDISFLKNLGTQIAVQLANQSLTLPRGAVEQTQTYPIIGVAGNNVGFSSTKGAAELTEDKKSWVITEPGEVAIYGAFVYP